MIARIVCIVVAVLTSPVTLAQETLHFKEPLVLEKGWLVYGIALTILLLISWWVAKKQRGISKLPSTCKLVEKKYLGNKTVVYIIDYQQQRFLLADNQQALALHPIDHEDNHA